MTPTSIVYIVDADGKLAAALQCLLDIYEIQVNAYKDEEQFLNSTTSEHETSGSLLLVLDSSCEKGLSPVRKINASRPRLAMIVLCDTPDESLRHQYIESGAIDIVSKSMVDAYILTRLGTTFPGAAHLPATQPATMALPDGTAITFRMMSPDDAEIEHQFVMALSARSRYLRFFSGLQQLPNYMLKQLTDPQFPMSYAVIATIPTAEGERQIGVARYSPTAAKQVAEFAVVVADEWHGHGIASQLLRGILTAATVAGIKQLEGLILRQNKPMLKLAQKLGFVISTESGQDATLVKVVKELR